MIKSNFFKVCGVNYIFFKRPWIYENIVKIYLFVLKLIRIVSLNILTIGTRERLEAAISTR